MSSFNPDNLTLSKEQILERLDKIKNNILNTKEGKVKALKFDLVFKFISWLVNHYDIDVLNKIFLGIIKEFDDLRYENALEGNAFNLDTLEKLRQIRESQKKV